MLDEKANSEYHKTKFRLRWYGLPSANDGKIPAFFEIKQKIGIQRRKVRKAVDVSAIALQPGAEGWHEFEALAEQASELGWSPVDMLFPMIVVRYDRFRFVEPRSGAQIAVDTHIHFTGINPRFFPGSGPRVLRHGVLEIKSATGEIPRTLWAIKSRVNVRDSFSKYEECWKMYDTFSYRRGLLSSRPS